MAISDDKEGLDVASYRSITSDSQDSEMQMHFWRFFFIQVGDSLWIMQFFFSILRM